MFKKKKKHDKNKYKIKKEKEKNLFTLSVVWKKFQDKPKIMST